MSTNKFASRLTSKEIGILASFIVFLFSILVFAMLYWLLYRYDPQAFLFGADIQAAQKTSLIRSARLRLESDAAVVEALEDIAKRRAQGLAIQVSVNLPSGRRYRIVKSPFNVRGVAGVVDKVEIWSRQGDQVARLELLDNLAEKRKAYARSLDQSSAYLAHLESDSSPRIWSFWDFLYFSTVTQATVGYGDMLPNSTRVRLVVVAQVIIGYAILVVLLNVVLSRRD